MNPKNPISKKSLAVYALAHFWMDLSCAFLLFRTLSGGANWALCLLLYNFCAFALQMPFGLLADRLNRNGLTAAVGCVLTAFACYLPGDLPVISIIAGVGNALFHLGGGIDVLNGSSKRAAALGVFVSPGALGLYIGTIWGRADTPWLGIAPLGLLVCAAAILCFCPRCLGAQRSGNVPLDISAPEGVGVLVPLFLVVVLRSYMGMNQVFPWKSQWAIALTLALVLGKTAGGFAMDRFGPQKASAGSLGLAAVLYLASILPIPGILAVFLFNMTMPVTLWAAAKVVPGAKGFAFGLLTFGLFIGFLPSFLGWPNLLTGPIAYAAAALVSLVLLVPALRNVPKGDVLC